MGRKMSRPSKPERKTKIGFQQDEDSRSYKRWMQKIYLMIEQKSDGSRMSSTKWREMYDALLVLYPQAAFSYRLRLLDEDSVSRWGWFTYIEHTRPNGTTYITIEGLGHSPIPIVLVEYIEIKPSTLYWTGTYWTQMPNGCQNQIEQQLDALQIPYTKDGETIRVTGHVRRSKNDNIAVAGNSVET